MKKLIVFLVATVFTTMLWAQKKAAPERYDITFSVNKDMGEKLYLGQHFRDDFIILDTAKRENGNVYHFVGNRVLERGIYSLITTTKDKKKSLTDFAIDDSKKFSVQCDSSFSADKMKVKGSHANQLMYDYIAYNNKARNEARNIQSRQKSDDPKVKEAADKEMDELTEKMIAYEKDQMEKYKDIRFFQLLKMFSGPDVPEEIPNEEKGTYYREHYWDGIDLSDHSLIHTPDLFNKMNYYFFGVLYYADKDTICKYADKMIDKVENDSVMMKYIMDFIMPKYFRSTKNIGWDAVWCHLVRRYYQPNRSKFALPGDVTYKVGEASRLEKSLIGSLGTELLMSDTMQRDNNWWLSSHRLPQKYVILWFWDPDCHHCQAQTATLITLYDSLTVAGTRNFEVYAIGFESDVPKWKRYVKEHHLPFINVGGPNVNVDYQVEYNVHGAPTMIILNADRRIIMNKTLPTNSIVPFIEQYEKDHPEQANREPSFWQIEGSKIWGNAYNPILHFNLSPKDVEERGVKSVNKVKGIR